MVINNSKLFILGCTLVDFVFWELILIWIFLVSSGFINISYIRNLIHISSIVISILLKLFQTSRISLVIFITRSYKCHSQPLKHNTILSKHNGYVSLRAPAILLVFKKIYSCLFIPNCTRNHVINYTSSAASILTFKKGAA